MDVVVCSRYILLFLFFSYPGVFQDGRNLNAICASLRILHFVHGYLGLRVIQVN